jgi:hypothetical protein
MKNEITSLLERIPDAEIVRRLLAQKLREAGILRQLLKVAERKRIAENIQQQSAEGVDDARP